MKVRYLAACMMIATSGASPLALGAPGNGAQATQWRANVAQAAGAASDGVADYSFFAQAYVDVDGVPAGSIYVDSFGSFYQYISCSGPEYANVVSMNQSLGTATVNGTLDPASPNCYSVNYNGGPLTVHISGQPDGSERNSQSGTGTLLIGGTTNKYSFQSDDFTATFTGTSGLYEGTFSGRTLAARSTNRTQEK
jgi:hypothetical protein